MSVIDSYNLLFLKQIRHFNMFLKIPVMLLPK